MESGDGRSWRELEAESVTMGVRHGGRFGDRQRWDVDTRGTPRSGERVKRFVINNTTDPRWNDILRAGFVGEVCDNVKHPVSKTEVSHRWSSDFEFVLFRLVENRLDFALLLSNRLIDVTFREGSALRGSHFAEVASF